MELASILLLGIGAQWLAWRLRLPSILLLLLTGFAVGPFTKHRLIDPDAILGDALLPFVSLSVAVILFEGGMTLRFDRLRQARRAVRNLVFIGAPLTFVFATVAARWSLDVSWGLAALFGSILIVTGPTVIIPLLRHVRPSGAVASAVRWEGILTDPVGAILAVLVFETLVHGGGDVQMAAATGLFKAVVGGGVAGAVGGYLLVFLLRRNLIPDFLHGSVSLALALLSFVVANRIQHESGLLAVTLMGILVANQRRVPIEHILEFKENLRVLLISVLFILLAARLPLEDFTRFDLRSAGFVLLLIFVVRPLMVFIATLGTKLSWQEKVFVAWMAPRGIVAAAVASVFALQLSQAGVADAERIVPVIFLVIIATVAIYGLTSKPLAKRLGLSKGTPQGVIFVGAHDWSRKMARSLHEAGIEILLVDLNHRDVQAARIDGLPAHFGSILSEEFEHTAPIDGMGHLLSLTTNDEVNALACMHFVPTLGRSEVFQVMPYAERGEGDGIPLPMRGNVAFGEGQGFWELEARFREGAIVKRTRLGEEFGLEDFYATYEREEAPVLPLFLLRADGQLDIYGEGIELEPAAGDTIFALVDPPPEEAAAEQPEASEAKAERVLP